MSRDDMHDLAMGAALVILGYALYKHFKAAPAATSTPAATSPATPITNNWTTTGPSSPYTSLVDLLTGTTHDIGGYGGQNYLAQAEAYDAFHMERPW